MSDIKQQVIFPGSGLNTDDNLTFLKTGDAPYRLNVTIGEDSDGGTITIMKGNKQVAYQNTLTLSNVYLCLGSYYNNLTRSVFFFIFSQPYLVTGTTYLYDNRLLRYNEDLGTVDTIFLDDKNYFGLDPTQLLTDIKMIGDWLFFNPRTDQPKMIDVVMAFNYSNYPAWEDTDPSSAAALGDRYTYKGALFLANTTITAGQDPVNNPTVWDRIGDSYEDESTLGITEFNRAFFAIKIPPADRIVTAYASDVTKHFNNVDGIVFRFCHRYQYFDDSFSVCSAHSNITLPVDNEFYNGTISGASIRNNYIKLSFSLYSPALVKNIEVFFQELGLDATTNVSVWSDWKRMTIINRQEQTLLDTVSYTYDFYNNEAYPIIAQTLPYIIQDAVPDKASAQEIINKNILCYAGCTEGKPNIDKDLINVTLTPVIQELPEGGYEGAIKRDNVASSDITQTSGYEGITFYFYTNINVASWRSGAGLAAGNIYKVTIDGITAQDTLGAGDIDTDTHLALRMSHIINMINTSTVSYGTATIVIKKLSSNPIISFSSIFTPSVALTSFSKQGGFKTGAYHPFCRFYYDEALRRGDAQITPDMAVYVPAFNENSPPISTTNHKYVINWEVNDEPPTWAKYWKWGYAGNRKCSYFVQYIIESIATSTPTDTNTPADVANTVKIDITPLQTIRTTIESTWNCYPNSIIPQYTFTPGDRIRFITEATIPATTGTTLGDVIDGTYDFEIIKFDPFAQSTNQVTGVVTDSGTNMIYIAATVSELPSIGINSLAEIYTPRKATTVETYYEFGDMMPIVKDADDNFVHGGQSQDQSLTASPLPATGTFIEGDVYHIMRTPDKPLCTFAGGEQVVGAFHESMWWSDFYTSNDWDRGKLGLESPIGQVTLNIIRYSNTYLQDTQINGITTFETNHYKELNDTYGNIVAIVEVGDTLKVYQEKKACSILIGRTSYYNATGTATDVQTQSFVLGTITYRIGNLGTTFPESISKNNRYVYGFDIYSGVVWRDSPSGIFPISGRYADIGASADYKMQSYFKSKSKALLTSGAIHTSVMTVWDEEYKMLYVVFKDRINNNNNETIVFHEPSDRWITLADFQYTPVAGYNEILELAYEVVKGFENGIGYSWNELTRFAHFNIGGGSGTPPNEGGFPIKQTINYTVLQPSMQITGTHSPNPQVALFEVFTPDIYITYVRSSIPAMTWQYFNLDFTDSRAFTIYSNPASSRITAKPAWISITSDNGQILYDVGSTIINGQVIRLYANEYNIGSLRTGDVTLVNFPLIDTCSIACSQYGPIGPSTPPPTGTCQMGHDSNGTTLTFGAVICTSSSDSITISFYPNNPTVASGASFNMYWTSLFKAQGAGVGVFAGNGDYWPLVATNGTINTFIVTLNTPLVSGDVINVYLSSSDTIVDPNRWGIPLKEIGVTVLDPTIIISGLSSSAYGMGWGASSYGPGVAQTATITSPPMNCYVYAIPSWIVLHNGIGAQLIIGDLINDGEQISMYPFGANTGSAIGENQTSWLELRNIYNDNPVKIYISQSAPDTQTFLTVSIVKRTGDVLNFAGLGGSTTLHSTSIQVGGYVTNPLMSQGQPFVMFWRTTVNGVYQGNGSFTVNSGTGFSTVISINNPINTLDVVVVTLGSVFF